jgi:hypothetical protein
MAENKKLITVAEAAKVLGRSASTIYAALNASPPRLHYHDVKRRLLLRDGLETRFSRSTRPRIDKPQAKAPQPELEPLTFDEKWEIIAEKANKTLDCNAWSAPPWSGEQWSVLSICIGEGVRQLQAETDEV